VWTVQHYLAQSRDDGKEMRCVATVQSLESTHVRATVLVQYGPLIECDTTEAAVGDRNVNLRCQVRARPPCNHAYWIIDNNGTTVSEGEVVNEHWQLIMDLGNGQFEMQLFIRYVTAQSFRNYTLCVENSVSSSKALVSLKDRSPRLSENLTRQEGHPGRHSGGHSGKQDASPQSYRSSATTILNDHHHVILNNQIKTTLILTIIVLSHSLLITS